MKRNPQTQLSSGKKKKKGKPLEAARGENG
jgi:hypothetical protein